MNEQLKSMIKECVMLNSLNASIKIDRTWEYSKKMIGYQKRIDYYNARLEEIEEDGYKKLSQKLDNIDLEDILLNMNPEKAKSIVMILCIPLQIKDFFYPQYLENMIEKNK